MEIADENLDMLSQATEADRAKELGNTNFLNPEHTAKQLREAEEYRFKSLEQVAQYGVVTNVKKLLEPGQECHK